MPDPQKDVGPPELVNLGKYISKFAQNKQLFGEPLSLEEKKYLEPILGSKLDLKAARTHPLSQEMMTALGEKDTPGFSEEDKFPYRVVYNVDTQRKGRRVEVQARLSSLFGHELTHTHQTLAKTAAAPDPRADIASKYDESDYEYGGVSRLLKATKEKKGFFSFDKEKQAAIVEDFIEMRVQYANTKNPKIKQALAKHMAVYQPFIEELGHSPSAKKGLTSPPDFLSTMQKLATDTSEILKGHIF